MMKQWWSYDEEGTVSIHTWQIISCHGLYSSLMSSLSWTLSKHDRLLVASYDSFLGDTLQCLVPPDVIYTLFTVTKDVLINSQVF